MNFWEAREAALLGEIVRMTQHPKHGSFDKSSFLNDDSWKNFEIAADWEIVYQEKIFTEKQFREAATKATSTCSVISHANEIYIQEQVIEKISNILFWEN